MTPGLRPCWSHTRLRRVVPWSVTLSNMKEKRSSTHYERPKASSGGLPVLLPSWAYLGKRSNRRSKSWESSGTASRRPDLSARPTDIGASSAWAVCSVFQATLDGQNRPRPRPRCRWPHAEDSANAEKAAPPDPKVPVIEPLSTGAALAVNPGGMTLRIESVSDKHGTTIRL